MTNLEYLKMLVEDIHSTSIATIGADDHPQTRCLHCGRCAEICPKQTIEKRG